MKLNRFELRGQGRRRWYLSRPAARRVVVGAALLVVLSSTGFSTAPPGSANPRTHLAGGQPGGSRPSLQWALPVSPVGRQLGWLLGAASRPPIPASEIRGHFDARFLGQISPQALNRVLAGLQVIGEWRIVTLDAGTTPGALAANVVEGSTRFGVEISVDGRGLISGLLVQPAVALPSPPRSWKQLDAELSALAPDVGFEAATVSASGTCTPVDAVSTVDRATTRVDVQALRARRSRPCRSGRDPLMGPGGGARRGNSRACRAGYYRWTRPVRSTRWRSTPR